MCLLLGMGLVATLVFIAYEAGHEDGRISMMDDFDNFMNNTKETDE